MSNDYARRIARLAVAEAADPANIAAATKEHARQQRTRKSWHSKRGQHLIDTRAELLNRRVAQLEKQLTNGVVELRSMLDDLASGQLTAADAKLRVSELVAAREQLPEQIKRLTVADQEDDYSGELESAANLSPVEASRDFSARFPAMRARQVDVDGEKYLGAPPLPENGQNGHDSQ